jgi:hypothetical protein
MNNLKVEFGGTWNAFVLRWWEVGAKVLKEYGRA